MTAAEAHEYMQSRGFALAGHEVIGKPWEVSIVAVAESETRTTFEVTSWDDAHLMAAAWLAEHEPDVADG